MLKEFKAFIMRGNVLDLAVGVVMGGAFGAIVTSLVNDLIMPLIGLIIGGVDFSRLSLNINGVEWNYGSFILAVVNFLIIALALFLMLKAINRFTKKKEGDPEPAQEPRRCPFCLETVADAARRCPHCTSELLEK